MWAQARGSPTSRPPCPARTRTRPSPTSRRALTPSDRAVYRLRSCPHTNTSAAVPPGLRDSAEDLRGPADHVRCVRRRGPTPAERGPLHPQGRGLVRDRLPVSGAQEGPRVGEGRHRHEAGRGESIGRHEAPGRSHRATRSPLGREIIGATRSSSGRNHRASSLAPRAAPSTTAATSTSTASSGTLRLDRLTTHRASRASPANSASARPSRTAISRRLPRSDQTSAPLLGEITVGLRRGQDRPATWTTAPGPSASTASARTEVTRLPKRSMWTTAPATAPGLLPLLRPGQADGIAHGRSEPSHVEATGHVGGRRGKDVPSVERPAHRGAPELLGGQLEGLPALLPRETG